MKNKYDMAKTTLTTSTKGIAGLLKQVDNFSKAMKETADLIKSRVYGMNLLSTHSNPYDGHKVPLLEEDLIEVDLMEEKVANKYW